jgi:hypothetical protein
MDGGLRFRLEPPSVRDIAARPRHPAPAIAFMMAPSHSHPAERSGRRGEILRWTVLAAAAAWLLHPFATNRQIGAGDALWYANMLADFVTQWRAGVFPVFAGQTEFAFNGAVYPLRVAPLYQHLAGVLDLLTGRQLGWFALQHLCVIVAGTAGLYGCYFSLCAIARDREAATSGSVGSAAPGAPADGSFRWAAMGLAILYLSCPGVLGTIYTQDLYMTWMTVPFLPLTIYGNVRAFQRNDWLAQAWLASGLALLWLGHAPIALWATGLSAGIQFARLLLRHRNAASWRRAMAGAGLFLLLAQYPFVSVASLGAPGTVSTVTSTLAHQEVIAKGIRDSFPGILLPLSPSARQLSDLQLGYGLWLILLVSLIGLSGKRDTLGPRLLLAACGVLLLLLLPVPGLNRWLWEHIPDQIKRITYYWPMQRFYLLVAAMLTAAAQLVFFTRSDRRTSRIAAAILVVAGGWSLWESRQFIRAGRERTASAGITARSQRAENLLLMNHSYGLFPAMPEYFSNGVMEPREETRLLGREHLQPLTLSPGTVRQAGEFRGEIDANPGILKLSPSFVLQPGHHYELRLDFSFPAAAGVLQLTGRDFFREYSLPSSGQRQAFGSAPANSPVLPLWTTASTADEITLRFIPTAAGAKPADFVHFGHFALSERDDADARAPLVLDSLLPFRATVRSSTPTWLETPRMFQAGYVAQVDGRPAVVQASPQALVMIPLEAGEHRVELHFRGPWPLRISYWLALLAWLGLLLGAVIGFLRRPHFVPAAV